MILKSTPAIAQVVQVNLGTLLRLGISKKAVLQRSERERTLPQGMSISVIRRNAEKHRARAVDQFSTAHILTHRILCQPARNVGCSRAKVLPLNLERLEQKIEDPSVGGSTPSRATAS